MVFDHTRILSGILILLFFSFFFILNFDLLFFTLLVIFIFYDLFKSKILKSLFIQLLFFSLFLFILIYSSSYSIILQLILFFIFVLFSLIVNLKFQNFLFILSLFLFLNLFYFSMNFNRELIFVIFFISFINDSCAYFFGNLIKGPKILLSISPKKTWSGTIISIIISSLIFILLDYHFLFSLFVSSLFFLGDIYFSFIKRSNQLKDFSNLIPGHGGVLDRLDSVFFSFVVIFVCNYYFL